MSLFPIYKVNKMTNKNKIETIYVFYGSEFSEDINDLFEEDPTNKQFQHIFDKDEIFFIQKNNIQVIFINQSIHIDDSIGIIKLKIFDAMQKKASMSELYLYCLKPEKLNPITVYQNLTQNDRLPLTKVRINQILLNLYDEEGNLIDFKLPDKPQYTFDDILKLDLTDKDKNYFVGTPLGQKFIFSNEYPFVSDPFLVTEYDQLLEKSRRELSTLSSHLLLETGTIFKNTIYLCLAKDVFESSIEKDISTEYTSKIYFPFLYKDQIETIDQLEEMQNKLMEETNSKLTEGAERNFDNINMFYKIYQNHSSTDFFSRTVKQTGIKYFKISIYPNFKIKVPIDVIFKLIHATEQFPLIKYNPETKQENMYRLFAPKLTVEGKKIPHLEKSIIFKLTRLIGKGKSVAVYTNIQYSGMNFNIACEFQDNGVITVYPLEELEKPILLNNGLNMFEHIDEIIRLSVNPLIEQIKPFFEQSGLEILPFVSIQSPNVEIRDMNYQFVYKITKPLNIDELSGCISSVFTVESSNFDTGIKMRYKRVSNYNKRESQEAFIIEKIDQGNKLEEIIEQLMQQFDELDREAAEDLISKIRSELEVTRGANKRRLLTIKINPGFQTLFKINRFTTELTINVSGINNIYYLNTIPVYIDTIIRITQDIDSCGIDKSKINTLCSSNEVEDILFGQITSQSEQNIENNSVPYIEHETPLYRDERDDEEGENMDDLLDMLGDIDESDMEGGQPINKVQKEPINKEPNEDQEEFEIKKKPTKKKTTKKMEKEKEKEKVTNIPEEKIKKQASQLENAVRDITGMKLHYPNPFSERLKERMPQLFVKAKNEKIDLYTRMCPFNLSEKRQPIVLTKEEKDKIIEEHPDPDDINEDADFIEYGTDSTDSSKKLYYTCPRYWCLLTDTMVTEKDILDGKCGPKVNDVKDAIISDKDETVPPGKYVYQFYGDDEKKYPGFHKKQTPSGLCIPCCYNNWDTPSVKNRRDICQGKFDEKKAEKVSDDEKTIEKQIQKDIVEIEQYVKGPEKYGPQLGENRWGFLPITVQTFLQQTNEDCHVSKTNMALKQHHTCILRLGVENSATQSFIACIASAIFLAQKDNAKRPLIQKFIPNAKTDIPTIKEMKQIIIKSIDLDRFIKYQNGDLITTFANPDISVDINNYKNTMLYKKINIKKETKQFIINVAQSFENFKNFLADDKITIDYTYLWDLICMPNPMLFEAGINLIILEMPEDDITNNIELVCPTNHYSVHTYDVRKKSLIILKRENYFEPIYGYRNDGKSIHVTKTFSERDKYLPKTLRSFFTKIVKKTLGERCRAFVSRPNEYRFQQPPLLDILIKQLLHKKFKIIKQVLNFQGKVIGVFAKNKRGLEGFIPCYPSALTNLLDKTCEEKEEETEELNKCNYDFVYMNDDIWKPYEDTLAFLEDYYDYEEPEDNNKANCFNPKYFCRVVENELITGFLTNTNQFVRIKEPVPISNVTNGNNLKTITNNDMLVADMDTLTNRSVDSKRVQFIKKIQLETNFYNVFRNTIRILFNDYSNSDKRKIIKDECNKRYSLYKHQLDTVIDLLHDLVQDTILFAETPFYDYKDINEKELQTCISRAKDKCETKTSVCKISNNKCQLVLPKKNLVNNTNNELFYYSRMADELIRYNRIKTFIFKPQSYLSFGQVKYNLRDNEIIILQDLLTQEFFENLFPSEMNRYAKYNTYDSAEPIITQTYKREEDLNDFMNPRLPRDCIKSVPNKIKSLYWRKCFPATFHEIEYSSSSDCSLYLIIDIIKSIRGEVVSMEDIKDVLIHIYKRLTDNFNNKDRMDKLVDVLKEEAQTDIVSTRESFETMIYRNHFIAVNFDLWLLLVYYEIPSIFISSKPIPETRFNSKEFVCYKNSITDKYVFILVPAMYKRQTDVFPEYKLIVDGDNCNIDLDEIVEETCVKDIKKAIKKYIEVEEYLDVQFKKDVSTKYKPRQKGFREERIFEEELREDLRPREDALREDLREDLREEEQRKPIKVCPDDQELNPMTNRCNKKCPEGQVRDEQFKCKKKAKLNNVLFIEEDKEDKEDKEVFKEKEKEEEILKPEKEEQRKPIKVCPEGQELNPMTNRCNKKCPEGQVRDEQFKCKTKKNKHSPNKKTRKTSK